MTKTPALMGLCSCDIVLPEVDGQLKLSSPWNGTSRPRRLARRLRGKGLAPGKTTLFKRPVEPVEASTSFFRVDAKEVSYWHNSIKSGRVKLPVRYARLSFSVPVTQGRFAQDGFPGFQ